VGASSPRVSTARIWKMVVQELVYRLSKKADFVTVSGRLRNDSNPKRLYESCGFKGLDLWYVCYKNKR